MTASDKLYIDNTDEKATAALAMADEFIGSLNVDAKKAIHLRLLAEETIGMVRAMTGDFDAYFWMEDDGEYRVRLDVFTDMDLNKKNELLSLSTSGVNTSAKGFMGKIREFIENSLLGFDYSMKLQQQSGSEIGYSYMGMGMVGDYPMTSSYIWSLQNYKNALDESDSDVDRIEAYDELERSIVASLAKDVTVGVKSNEVNLTIVAR